MRILLICDRKDWILGRVARELSKRLCTHGLAVQIMESGSDGFSRSLQSEQQRANVVHFLSPWDFYAWADRICVPCAVTLWHIVDWSIFDPHAYRIDALWVSSQQWLERATKHMPLNVPIQRARYGLDTNRFVRNPLARSLFLEQANCGQDTLVFGFAGKASSDEASRKGLDRLWRCLARLKEERYPFVLRMIGHGWQPEMIPGELRGAVQLGPYIDIDGDLLSEFYSSLDYYVCTSRHEGVPYPVLEAMSCECTVLSTLVGVVPEILVNGHNGFILREDSIDTDFTDAVHRTGLSDNARRNCGQAARRTVTEAFSWDSVADPEGYADLCQQAIRFHRSRPLAQRLRFVAKSTIRRIP